MDILHFVYLLLSSWTFALFPFWLSVMLPWTFMYKLLCGHMFSFLWGIELLSHMITLCLTFWGTGKLFSKWLQHFIILPSVYEDSNFSTSLSIVSVFLILAILLLPLVASVVSDFVRPYGLQPVRLLCPWDSVSRSTRVGCHYLHSR